MNLEKLCTGFWIFFRRGNPLQRLKLYSIFQAETARWIETQNYEDRIRNAISCPDNAKIPRAPKAGLIENGMLTLHNGLRVHELSYDGEGPRSLMVANRGVHEPQEEFVFQEVLKSLESGATMLELGSYWAFYSIWFASSVKQGRCICVEPCEHNLKMGMDNFRLNMARPEECVKFERAYAGSEDGVAPDRTPIRCVDSLLRQYAIETLAILHADTQGHELEILQGAQSSLEGGKIDWVFLSTHSNYLHRKCLSFLKHRSYKIVCDADLLETYSWDGLIVACHQKIKPPSHLKISLRSPSRTAGKSKS